MLSTLRRDAEVTVESQESPSRAADLPRAGGSGPRARPLAPAQCSPAQPSAIPSRPGRSYRGSPPRAPLTARWAAARAPATGGQLGSQETAELTARTPRGLCTHVTPSLPRGPLAWSRPQSNAVRPRPLSRPTAPVAPPFSWHGRLVPRSPRPQFEWTVSVASPGRHNSGGPRTCPLQVCDFHDP